MTLFLPVALAMGVAVLAILLWPLLKPPAREPLPEPTMSNDLSRLREQLLQLDALRDSGALDAEAHAQARAKLERALVDQVMQPATATTPSAAGTPATTPATATSTPPRRTGVALALGAAAVVLVVAGYQWLGRPDALSGAAVSSAAEAPATETAPHPMAQDQMRSMVDSLAERLAAQPDDPEGWGMLARSYAVLGDHARAVPAFRKAMAGQPDDPVLLADLADALAVTQDRRIAGEPLALVQRALAADPFNLKALSLAGSEAFARSDYAAAIGFWERMQRAGKPDHPLVLQIADSLAEARQLAGGPAGAGVALPASGQPAAAPTTLSALAGASQVSGQVTLDPALAAKAQAGDTVFIFARAAQGPRMPLAVLRRTVKDLPLTFTLDDSLAMSPALKLSSQSQVVVGARISRSGQAIPQPGDLVGDSGVVTLGRKDLDIRISEVVQP